LAPGGALNRAVDGGASNTKQIAELSGAVLARSVQRKRGALPGAG
jgi:hypothetical protein